METLGLMNKLVGTGWRQIQIILIHSVSIIKSIHIMICPQKATYSLQFHYPDRSLVLPLAKTKVTYRPQK